MVCCMGWGMDDQERSKMMMAQRRITSHGRGSNYREQGWVHGPCTGRDTSA